MAEPTSHAQTLTTSIAAAEFDDDLLPMNYFPFGTHVSKEAWDRYHLLSLVRASAKASDTYVVRELARLLNASRAAQASELPPVSAGQLLTAGLIVDILRYIIDKYCWEEHPGIADRAVKDTKRSMGETGVDARIHAFAKFYPATEIQAGRSDADSFLRGETRRRAHRDIAVWETALLRLVTQNRAMRSFRDLFDDSDLERAVQYRKFVNALETFYASQPPFGPLGQTIFEVLRAPMLASPDSLEGQLEYILQHWATFLPPKLLQRVLVARGVMREETQQRGHGPGPAAVLTFGRGGAHGHDDYPEPERFTRDADWMSNVVLLAKSTYVWLDQLSRQYQRSITRLDEVPDEELERLGRWGFSGLWLIGVWERSTASADIKRMMGNAEALSSAYSLFDYRIADDLGGEPAYQNLRDRAWRHGVRLASDMVPNHMGVYSQWVIDHPDWFVQLDYPPFPGYQFNGANLSRDPRYTIQIEDGYWDKRDASVVFRLIENSSGRMRYIYHGNDGTSMPWNDTAQLNYMMPEVREAVTQTILGVARRFPIIRFDAAMTLAKRHYQRLWFPKPGEGGAIPSRAEHGMNKQEFDAHMPEEFWREVVDRVQREAPDTLLLAEAFWLMEGYFVRTLGMHRVYNSAFMNMLKMEENSKYRATVKNVLEFSPEVLKRFVNFMSNPDERTAVEQFGRGDKYYGVAVLMTTMPGLPMFAHGQIEGYNEKYGMEYRKAYWDEQPDQHMIFRHESEVFPLMRRRHLFSGVEHFAFFDFRAPEGHTDENVFAHTNRSGGERALIVYNNAYNTTRGTVQHSCAINRGSLDNPSFVHPTLGEALAIRAEENIFYIFRDHRSATEYIRQGAHFCREGFSLELHAYQYCAFVQWREVFDSDGSWGKLAYLLEGRGVPSIDIAHREMQLAPLLGPLRNVLQSDVIAALCNIVSGVSQEDDEDFELVKLRVDEFDAACPGTGGARRPPAELFNEVMSAMRSLGSIGERAKALGLESCQCEYLLAFGGENPHDEEDLWHVPVACSMLRLLAPIISGDESILMRPHWMDEWLLTPLVALAFRRSIREDYGAMRDAQLVKLCFEHRGLLEAATEHQRADTWRAVLADGAARDFLDVNRHAGATWVNKEYLEQFVATLYFCTAREVLVDGSSDDDEKAYEIGLAYERAIEIVDAAAEAGYDMDTLNTLLT
jgi:glycosidase